MPNTFGQKLAKAFAAGGQLCVGIDPSSQLLADWGLSDDARGLAEFGKAVVGACADKVSIIKPQVAFFERHGSAGFAALERLALEAQQAGLLVIMDAKRGDIGSTMDGYFGAWLGQSAPFHSDALTVSPYLGFESLQPVLAAAHERGKGVFVLAATSNPEARKLQLAVAEGISVANSIWQSLGKINRTLDGAQPGSFGAVIGATVNPNDYGIELTASPTTPILAPGFGAQGAALGQLQRLFGSASDRVIATVSRSVLQHGALGLETAIDAAKTELANQTIAAGHDE